MTRSGAVLLSAALLVAAGTQIAHAGSGNYGDGDILLGHPRYESKVTLKEPGPAKRGTFRYGGRVRSESQACEKGREVILYRKVGDVATVLESTEADNQGKYFIDWDANSAGDYYTKVKKLTAGGKTCTGDKSEVWTDVT